MTLEHISKTRFVSGHDFSRAEETKKRQALAPEEMHWAVRQDIFENTL
jgi:hypothetical protein